MSSVGLSQVNFDVQGLEDDDEEQQLEKEDEERERELRELLSNELPDDLLDDDNLSFSFHGLNSPSHGQRTPDFNDQFEQFTHEDAHDPEGSRGATSYEQVHPLLTRRGEEFIQNSGSPSDTPKRQSIGVMPPESVPRGYNFSGANYGFSGDIKEHGGIDGSNVEFEDQGDVEPNQGYVGGDRYQPDGYHTRHSHAGGYPNSGEYTHVDRADVDDFHGYHPVGYQTGSRNLDPDSEVVEPRSLHPIHDQNFNEVYPAHEGGLHLQEPHGTDNRRDLNDNYKVLYTRNWSVDDNDGRSEEMEREGTAGQRVMAPPSSELAQLRVLHQARGRKLEELTKEMALKEKDYERQIRLLNHHLALMKGEREGMSSSLKHAQELAAERKNDCDDLEGRLHVAQMEKEQTIAEKNETESELEASKKTIDSLHQQLMELEKSESLSRAREQHENILVATRKRYEEEVVRLKQKLDDVNNSLLWKNEESKRLHDELSQARKEADRVRLDRAETVNRLTKSLEQSQKQNEELLKAGSTQEISHLQSQLQRTQRENEDLQEHYKTVEANLIDLKEQLRIYESVSKLGFTMKNETVSPIPGTGGIKRNLEADNWKTPQPSTTTERDSTSQEALCGLQKELQHALATNRSKREEIEQLRAQLDIVKQDLTRHKNENERMEMLMKKQEKKVLEQEKKISDLEELTKNPGGREEQLDTEVRKLESMVEEFNAKVELYEKREKELEKLNLQLKSQMSEMVREHDMDKQKSVEECRQSCLQFHDQAMNTMKEQLTEEHEKQLSELRNEQETMSSELHHAKESYVVLSEETRWIEKQTRERCDEETKRKIEELQAEWDRAKCCEIENLRQNIITEMERNFSKEKASWQKSEDEAIKGKIQAEIALAKMDWTEEHEKLRQEAVESALKDAEKEWTAKYGKSETPEGWEEKLNSMKIQWEKEKENEIKEKLEVGRKEVQSKVEKEHDERLRSAREEWARVKAMEIDQELRNARSKWDQDLQTLITQATESSVTLAKADWSREQDEIHQKELSKAIEEAKAEALASAKENWEQEKKNMDMLAKSNLQSEKEKWHATAEEERSRAVETAVLLAEQKWQSEHDDKVSGAVKNALEVAKEAWSKERDTAIESAVSQSLRTAKEAWNENKVREIEQVLSAARKQWFTEFDILRMNSTTSSSNEKAIDDGSSEETNKTFSYLEAQYSKNLKEFRETELKKAFEDHGRNKAIALKEMETKYKMELKQLEENHRQQTESVTKKSQEDWGEELKRLETSYQSKLQGIVDEMEEKWNEKTTTLEEDWNEKYERERVELEESYRVKFQKEREALGRELRDKYEKAMEHARKKLEHQFKERLQSAVETAKHEWEEEQEEDRLAVEEQHLKKLASEREKLRNEMEEQAEIKLAQIKNEASNATRRLEQQLGDEKQRYTNDIEHLQRQLQDPKQRSYRANDDGIRTEERKTARIVEKSCKALQTEVIHDQKWISLTDLTDQESSNSKLHELRRQYLVTTAKLKEDVHQHVIQTRKNAAKAIRTEVMKERHATAKRLRKYYLECLKELLDNDKEAFRNKENPRSDTEKMTIMEERLTFSDETEDAIKSQDSTLTNVTALTDNTLGQDKDKDPDVRSQMETSGKTSREQSGNQHRSPQKDSSHDTRKIRTRPPRIPPAESSEPKVAQRSDDQDHRSCANFSGSDKHGVAGIGSNLPVKDDSKGLSKERFGTNSRRLLASSTESLLAFDTDGELDLPPAIKFGQQDIPKHLLPPDDLSESETTSSSDRSGTSNNDRNREKSHGKRLERNRHAHENTNGKSEKIVHAEHGGKTYKRRTTSVPSHSRPYLDRPAVKFAHPVISRSRNERPAKVTSSLPKHISDVLPSKPLSPIHQASPKFSYTMHSETSRRKASND